jgi:hypothetical protein
MFELVVFILLAVVVPVLVNKTTESHLHWLKPRHLRPIWTVVFALLSLYFLQKPAALGFVVHLQQKWHGWIGSLIFGAAAAIMLASYWWLTGVLLKPNPHPTEPKQATPAAQNDNPPTLLDLFKNDFSNTLRSSDKEDAISINWRDGATTKVKRQVYMDFPAKTKFVGFYVAAPTPRSADISGIKTFNACLTLLEHDSVQQAFDHVSQSVAILAGRDGQMTSIQALTFSGRVLIYHEDFLSIPQKADVLRAYATKSLDVQFMGSDYLGDQVIAWHRQHDAKATL